MLTDYGDAVMLLDLARDALSAHERTSPLAAAVPDPGDTSPSRIALFGPYSAGKSLLIAALLRMSAEEADGISAATPHTTELKPYPWRHFELLDLPGTLSERDEHDRVAREGVRKADALMIVTTVELPGDEEAAEICQLLDHYGYRGRCVLVVNKAGSENSDREVIRTEIERRIGHMDGIPTLFTDARDFLDSINEPELTEDDQALLRADSGIDELEHAVEALFLQQVAPRRMAQLHEAIRLLDDGVAVWQPTIEEEVVQSTAARAQAAIETARREAVEAIDRSLVTLGDNVRALGPQLAEAVDPTTGAVPAKEVEAATAVEEQLYEQYLAAVNQSVADAVGRLARDLASTREKQEQYTRVLKGRRAKVPTDPVEPATGDRLVEALRQRLSQEASRRLTHLVDQGTRAGSPLHDLARDVNRLLKKKPKSYSVIHTAETMSKALSATNFALEVIAPAVDIGSVIQDARTRHRINQRRDKILGHYAGRADAVVADERERVRAHVEAQFRPYVVALSPQLEEAAEWLSTRDAACAQLQAVRDRIAEAATLD